MKCLKLCFNIYSHFIIIINIINPYILFIFIKQAYVFLWNSVF